MAAVGDLDVHAVNQGSPQSSNSSDHVVLALIASHHPCEVLALVSRTDPFGLFADVVNLA